MILDIPELSLVVLAGVSGAGKTTFAKRHFAATQVLSSDACRGLVCDDEGSQSATSAAFDVLHYIAGKRLRAGRLTVIDATSVRPEDRKSLIALAKSHDVLAVVIALNVPAKLAIARNEHRPERPFGSRVVKQQAAQLRRGLHRLKREGFARTYVLSSPEEIEAVEVRKSKLWNDRRDDHGPFDIIGDVHGCYDELVLLLEKLGYRCNDAQVTPPAGRRALFVGDLVDRGPNSPAVLRLVMQMVADGHALCISGNHEAKLGRKLSGRNVKLTHGLKETMDQLAGEPEAFVAQARTFIDGLISHYVLDRGRLVVAHAGLPEAYHGRASGRVRSFCLYGQTKGETDAYGLPVRHAWANDYRGRAMVVYGHTPTTTADWVNGTICVDTGCVFGGQLTALRYPERELAAVDALAVHYTPTRPLADRSGSKRAPDVLDINDVLGKRIVDSRLGGSITISAEHNAAALEVLSRFCVDPRWLIYLPPTMSPAKAAPADCDVLERPQEAFDYYAGHGVPRVICEHKHMGSRAVIVLARSKTVAQDTFGIKSNTRGVIYTRSGRPFFRDTAREQSLLARVATAMQASGLWEELATDWICLDAELMPWSLKAAELVHNQYEAVGVAGEAALSAALASLRCAHERGTTTLAERFAQRVQWVQAYDNAWRPYCWPVDGLEDIRLAPFAVLASRGATYFDKPHTWHMETLARLAECDDILRATPYRVVDLDDPDSRAAATQWWQEHTENGGEGMVVKPEFWLHQGKRGLVQPALKCRGKEYLRMIYGPEYTDPTQLERLRARKLGTKRSLASREFALGAEGLYRLAAGEASWRVHECVASVLALEAEPVDPRL